jgi:hypothetical protein
MSHKNHTWVGKRATAGTMSMSHLSGNKPGTTSELLVIRAEPATATDKFAYECMKFL